MNSRIPVDPSLNALLIGGGILNKEPQDSGSRDLLEHALDMTGSEKTPNVLHIPTAEATLEMHNDYTWRIGSAFESLGAIHTVLHDFILDEEATGANKPPVLSRLPSADKLEERIRSSDLIFVAGGNTRKMLEVWRSAGIDQYLEQAIRAGIVVSGISAGAIAWAEGGHSDSDSYETDADYDKTGENGWTYQYIPALGYLATVIAPHYDSHAKGRASREEDFTDMMLERPDQVGIGIDNNTAVQIVNGNLEKVMSSGHPERRKKVFIVNEENGDIQKHELE